MHTSPYSRRQFVGSAASLGITAGLSRIFASCHTMAIPSGQQNSRLFAYVGTFSSPLKDTLPTQVDLPPGNGRGIHIFEINRQSGAMIPAGTFDLGTSPSCVTINRSGDRLYSANETDRVGNDKQGSVSSFAIDKSNGQLRMLNSVKAGGAGPTYVSIHPSGKFLLVANYFGGSVAVFPILKDGTLADASDVKNDEGKIGPTRAVNAPPGSFAFSGHDRTHAHMIESSPDGRYVLHVDLGLDRIFIWAFDAENGTLSPAIQPFVELPPGDGPRHFYFHPNGKWFYSIQEEGSTLVVFDYEKESGQLTPRQTISTLPERFVGSNFCSEVLVSSDGRYLYAGNRLHDSIGVFAVGADGTLSHVDDVWTRGNYPRSFSIDPSGTFLYCCNQRADHVAVFQVDRETGKLEFTGDYGAVGNPSMIAFLEIDR
ncbi:MAG: lactonase family protein [Planctomycetaceae bacterium]